MTAMILNELQEQALKLSSEERLQLIDALRRSIQVQSHTTAKSKGLVASLVGIAKTEDSVPNDDEVKAMLDERLVQKYS
ncbi:MAG: hypothetical protein AAFY33_15700 [Cyanobacteria bacterium J06643_4]